MSTISPPVAPPVSRNSIDAPARSQWSFGRLLSRAIVILMGIAVGCFIGVFIGLLTGWIEIQLC
jgi:NhaP-type Na+/H+ or K+/H+ antiporter